MALSIDLRERVIGAIDGGMRVVDAVKVFSVCRKAIYNWMSLRKETNSLAPKSGYQKGHSHKVTDWEQFKLFAEEHKHHTAKSMAVEWGKLNNISATVRAWTAFVRR